MGVNASILHQTYMVRQETTKLSLVLEETLI